MTSEAAWVLLSVCKSVDAVDLAFAALLSWDVLSSVGGWAISLLRS